MTDDPYYTFLANTEPFNQLASDVLFNLTSKISVSYHKAGEAMPYFAGLTIIRSGSFELTDQQGALVDRLTTGEFIGVQSIIKRAPADVSVTCIEDALLIQLPQQELDWLTQHSPQILTFISNLADRRLAWAQRNQQRQRLTSHDHVRNCMSQDLLVVQPATTIAQAAKKMTEHKVSSVLVSQADKLVGIVTDRDLRSRVIAQDLSPSEPVAKIVSSQPITISPDASVFDAMILMTEHNVHHLPVVANELVGLVTSSDLMGHRQFDPVNTIKRIRRSNNFNDLQQVCTNFQKVLQAMYEQGEEGSALSLLASRFWDAVTSKLIEFEHATLVNLPPHCWVAFGSHAREDMHLGSDQDNGWVVSDEATDEDMQQLMLVADQVNKRLNELGLRWCDGGVMACKAAYCRRQSDWQWHYQSLAEQSNEQAVLNLEILLDIRAISGEAALLQPIFSTLKAASQRQQILTAELTKDLLRTDVHGGWLDQLFGKNKSFSLKQRILTPLNDMTRLLAFSHELSQVSSDHRLKALIEKEPDMPIQALIDGREFALKWRWGRQLVQQDDVMTPNLLTAVQRYQLKELLSALELMQKLLGYRYLRRV